MNRQQGTKTSALSAEVLHCGTYDAGGAVRFQEGKSVSGIPGSLSSAIGGLGKVSSAVNSQSPPANPNTPQIRIDTQRIGFLDLTRIIESIKRAMENESDETMQQFYQLFLGLMESRKAGTAPPHLLQELAQAVMPAQPSFGAPGMAGPMMPMPPQSAGGNMGATSPAAPQGTPSGP